MPYTKLNPLRQLREDSGFSQIDISQRAKITQTKLSLAENNLLQLTAEQEESVRKAIVDATAERTGLVAISADPRLREALRTIKESASKTRVFRSMRQAGRTELESALITLGRRYPS